ncbi:hypothetical protein [Enterococcus sp.]|uniref:hypothetical protein n=1 Tax=Enterococcus sp. TaxID=35783 RepID=UPI003C76B3B1
MNGDLYGHAAWWIGAAAWDTASYLIRNRKKGYTVKGLAKSALRGGITGVALGGAGKILNWARKGGRIIGSAKKFMKVGMLVSLIRMSEKLGGSQHLRH